jgi:phosphoglycolate phosphatase
VDGTLIESVGKQSNALHKEAFTEAFKQIYGIGTHIDVVQHHGATDPLVLMKVLVEAHGMQPEDVMAKLDEAKACMVAYYMANKSRCDERRPHGPVAARECAPAQDV